MKRTSLVVQWIRVQLPMQGTWVRSLVLEDPACHGAAKPVCRNCWDLCAVTTGTCASKSLRTQKRVALTLCNRRKPAHHNEIPHNQKQNRLFFTKGLFWLLAMGTGSGLPKPKGDLLEGS